MNRLNAKFTVKSLDNVQGIIEGIASTPTPDRMGDIVESSGAQFTLPLPLCWQHDTEQPIGHVTQIDVRADGLYIVAQLAAAGITPEIDKARAYTLNGLANALSLGFKPIEFNYMEGGGLHISSYEVYEISVVTIPANADAQITSIKSIQSMSTESATIEETPGTETVQPVVETPAPVVRKRVPSAAPALHLNPQRPYSLKSAIGGMLGVAGIDSGFEREIAAEMVRRSPGKVYQGVPVPFGAFFTKAAPITSNAATTGANFAPLVGTEYADRLLSFTGDALPRQFLASRLGAQTEATSEKTFTAPVITQKIQGEVISLDGSLTGSASASDTTEIEPVTVGCMTTVKRSVFYSHGGEAVLRQQVGNAISETIDSCLIGPASGAMPDGLLDLGTAATVASIPQTEAGYRAFREELRAYLKAVDAPIKFLLPSAVADALGVTPRFTGAVTSVLDESTGVPRIAGTEVVLSHEVGSNLLIGKFDELFLVLFQQGGIDCTANPYLDGDWQSGAFSLRAMVDIGVFLRDPAAVLIGTAAAPGP